MPDAARFQRFANGQEKSSYDSAHRLTKITDGQGNHIDYTLDAMGNRTAEYAFSSVQGLLCLPRASYWES
jgi:YD repeat-containing protein